MNVTETSTYEEGIYQIELTDPVIGGADGIANLQAKQLANRTNWLKVAFGKIVDGTTSIAKALKLATARKISLGGDLSGSANFDGSTDITIEASFANGALTINSIQGLSSALESKQASDATLTALANLTTAANKLIYATGSDTFSTTDLTAIARALLAGADASTMRNTLEVPHISNPSFSGNVSTSGSFVVGIGGDSGRGSIYSDPNWGMLFRAKIDAPVVAPFIWMNGNGSELFRHNGSALTTNITGNAATATVATLAQTANLASIADVSNAVANTTFVYRAQGNLKLQSGVLGDVTLTQNMAGQMLIMAGTPTLPPINTIRAGSCFYLLNNTTAAIGIVLNGNVIDTNYPVIYPKETLILQSDGGFMYRVVSRSRELASNMNASAGYAFLNNGLLIQWGYASPSIAPKGGVLNVTFPITFPNGVFYSNAAIVDASVNAQLNIPFCVATSNSNLHITNEDVDSYITQIRWVSIGY